MLSHVFSPTPHPSPASPRVWVAGKAEHLVRERAVWHCPGAVPWLGIALLVGVVETSQSYMESHLTAERPLCDLSACWSRGGVGGVSVAGMTTLRDTMLYSPPPLRGALHVSGL